MSSKSDRDEKKTAPVADRKETKPRGELSVEELDKVSGGGDAASGLASGKRQHLPVTF